MSRRQNKIILTGLSIFLVSAALAGCAKNKKEPIAPITVNAQIDRTVAAIGDKLKFTIVIRKDKDIEIEPFVFNRNFGNFAIKDFGSKKSISFKREKITQWFILDTYITGKTIIPKMVVRYKLKKDKDYSQIETDEIAVEVKSLLDKAGPTLQMQDVKGPVNLPAKINKYLILAGVFLLAVLSILARYFLKKNKAPEIIPGPPAHEIAYQQLMALKEKNYIQLGKIKEYYTEVSDIIRHYLEQRFKIKAPEMTTEEFLIKVRDSSGLINEHKNLLKEFLLCCDLVKFAKYAPANDEISAIWDSAKHFIDQTKENEPA